MPNQCRLPSVSIPLTILLLAGAALAAGIAPQGAKEPRSQPEYRIRTQINLKVPMRDGVNLAADVFRPDARGKFPTLLLRSYHGTQGYMKMALYFARRGYAVVMVDVRGRYDSDGEFEFYVYEPEHPVPTLGGRISTNPKLQGPRDRQALQERQDILVYTSEPLEEDLEVTGPVELKLYAASSAVDTDFTAALTDVYPDGRAILICEGIRRASFRESLEHPTPIEPGKIYEYAISLWATSNVFKAGHRIRVEVSSSDFPRYARNLNTGNRSGMSAEMLKARQTIHHSKQYPSRLVLPVIP